MASPAAMSNHSIKIPHPATDTTRSGRIVSPGADSGAGFSTLQEVVAMFNHPIVSQVRPLVPVNKYHFYHTNPKQNRPWSTKTSHPRVERCVTWDEEVY